jgi:hypothetical protein
MPDTPTTQLVPLPTQSQVQARYDAATAAGVPPCLWIPPTWAELETRDNPPRVSLPNNSADNELFNYSGHDADARSRIHAGNDKDQPEGPERPPTRNHWPNPFSDFSHEDHGHHEDQEQDDGHADYGKLSIQSLQTITDAIDPTKDARTINPVLTAVARILRCKRDTIVQALGGNEESYEKALAVLDGYDVAQPGELDSVANLLQNRGELKEAATAEVRDALAKLVTRVDLPPWTLEDVVNVLKGTRPDLLNRRNALNQLQKIVGTDSHGMERLAQVFEWLLWRTTVLMDDLNQALAARDQDVYNAARANYINFVRDVDDHEPEKSDRPIDVRDKAARSGYGRALKWACIDPVIYNGRIIGTRTVVKWNPHSSSSGYALPDPPPDT